MQMTQNDIYTVLTVILRDVETNSASNIGHITPKVALLFPLRSAEERHRHSKNVVFHSLTPWPPNLNGVTWKSEYKCRQHSKFHTRNLRKPSVVYLLWKTKLAFLQEKFFLVTLIHPQSRFPMKGIGWKLYCTKEFINRRPK